MFFSQNTFRHYLVGAGFSGSLSWCHFLCALSRGSHNLHFTNFLIFLSCLGVLRSEGTPERVFLHFFRRRFRTRACTDFLGKRTQERLFLQRQKSECKISYRVRGMGPPQGPAFACTVTTINKTKQKKLKKKNTSFITILELSNMLRFHSARQRVW